MTAYYFFTNAWEQRKLGEVAEFSKGSGYSKQDLQKTGTPIILYGRLYTNYDTVIDEVDTFVDEKVNSVKSSGNEIIVPASGETAEDIARASVVVSPDIILGGDLNIIKTHNDIDPVFLAITISNGQQQKEMSKRAQGKSVVHLYNSDLREVSLKCPLLPEQTAIGIFFRTLDDTITLHKRKLDGLRELKKGYLQNMFPQAGECVPRVRFADFSEPWQERKLGDVAEFSKGNGYSKNDLRAKGTPIILYGRLYTNYETIIKNTDTFTNMKKNPVLSCGGEVIVPSSGETAEDISRASVVAEAGVILGGDLNIIKPNKTINSIFLAVTISNGKQQMELSKRAQGKSVVHLSNSDLKGVMLQLPKLPEQTTIGNFFQILDEQITAQAAKLKQLRQLKAAYLQKMFI